MHDSIKAKIGDKYIIDHLGRVLYSNRFSFNTLWSGCEQFTHELEQHGPAITFESQRDNVIAIYCSSMPDECKVLFNKINQADHWLKPETRIKASTCGVYLVAPGNLSHTFAYDPVRSTVVMHVHYARDYSHSQWRMSTNLIERLLMFDLNIAQMKTFILTKMIRKELLKPIVGDRLSTFYMKTALFFTVETFPKDIWTNDNLVHCVLYCQSHFDDSLNVDCVHIIQFQVSIYFMTRFNSMNSPILLTRCQKLLTLN
ncbi:hypothetical protein DPMN_094790 [Dreissena polymorpha]|uniref:Uncharacterized protein n=1 Tax=Dreissena polymorpha TaxID=45954 RepID=A0A9D4R359_DREPO|nr:hypothetical protein DPMN_094790 [Dreissena polymorpha]